MTSVLGHNSYGKSQVRLVKVTRRPDRHELTDLTVDVALEGDFTAAHVAGDNAGLLATDTMRNTVYALAQGHDDVADLERFGLRLVEHFVAAGPRVTGARVRLVAQPWSRLATAAGAPDPHAFQGGSGGRRIAVVAGGAGGPVSVEAGIEGLVVLKTTGSGWEGYHHDELTSLPETDDRIMATEVTARWTYRAAPGEIDFTASWEAVRDVILTSFGDHYSPSVQFTLHRMGDAVLGGPGRGGADLVLAAQQAPPAVRPRPLRPRERQRDLPADDGALRPDRGDGRTGAGGGVGGAGEGRCARRAYATTRS